MVTFNLITQIQSSIEKIEQSISSSNQNIQNLQVNNNLTATALPTASANQALSAKDLELIGILNNFEKTKAPGAWTGGQLTRSGGCVETAMTAMQYLQKQSGVASGGNLIGSLPVDSRLKGLEIQDLQAAFDDGRLKPGDIITTTTPANLGRSVDDLAAGGKGLNNHAAIVTAVLNQNTGKYEIRLIDNDSKTAKSSTLQEYISFIGNYSPIVHSVQKPNYGNGTSTIATTKNKSLTTA
jgi:hypothetical protein